MPILKGKRFAPVTPAKIAVAKDSVYTIPFTNEQFSIKEEYDERMALYNESIWTCQCTGATKMTYQEAMESEDKAYSFLTSNFPVVFEKPVLELVHHSPSPLDTLVDRASRRLYEMLVIGEPVTLKVKANGVALRGVVVKVDSSDEKVDDSSSNSQSHTDGNDEARKKPKLLPCKYSIKLNGQDKIINGIPACDLIRETHVPNKDLIKLFIRARSFRTGNPLCGYYVVDESYVRKHSLQSKATALPFKASNSENDSSKSSPKENKPQKIKANDSPGKHSAKKSKIAGSENKHNGKSPKQKGSSVTKSASKKVGTPEKKARKRLLADDSSSDTPLAQKIKKRPREDEDSSDSDDDVLYALLKKPAKKKIRKDSSSDMPLSELQNRKDIMSVSSDSDDDDVALAKLKTKKSTPKKKKDKNSKDSKTSPSKIKLKQVTLYRLNFVKKSTPTKTGSPSKSPGKTQSRTPKKKQYQLPPLAARLQKAHKEQSKGLYVSLLNRCVRELTDKQIKSLPDDIKVLVMPKFELYQEKKKLESMTEADREAYLQKKKEERKQQLREALKKKMAESRQRCEDTQLELQPLPDTKLVQTPDGIPNELFGDVIMLTEFISCYRGLLMPDDNTTITSDQVMIALVSGHQGAPLLSKILVVLLQTLLQDQLAEDYKELSCPLSELPVNEYTAGELARLCLRTRDASDDSDADSDDAEESYAHNEVPGDVVEQLETSEFIELEPSIKLQVLVGLCHRIMASYSVQDFMEEKQQESTELWKKRNAEQKAENEKLKDQKAKKAGAKKEDKEKANETNSTKQAVSNGSAKPETLSKSESTASLEDLIEDDDGLDLVATLKRRRLMVAKAAEEKKRKEEEDKLLREELKILRDKEILEKNYKEVIMLVKRAMRVLSLGTDRNHDRYWIFPNTAPGLYIEKGWIGDYGCYSIATSQSLSDAEQQECDKETEAQAENSSTSLLNTTLPHTGQNLWFVVDTVEDVQKLIDSLHPKGVRESVLKEALKNNYDIIVKSISKAKRAADVQTSEDHDDIIEGTRKELEDLETRLRQGGLGGVPSFDRWEKQLMGAKTLKDFADCLKETQAFILERFVTGMMAKVCKKKSKEPINGKEDDEETENEDNDDTDSGEESSPPVDGIRQWLDAVDQCPTYSRLNVLMGMLESCVKWEKSAENAKCKICRKKGDDDRSLLCDDCNQAYHLYCLRPALCEVPSGEWYCPACSPSRATRRNERNENTKKCYREDSSDEGISESADHESSCAVCGESCEELAECPMCDSSFHLDCHEPPLRHIPRSNTWKCMQCKSGIRIRKKSSRNANKPRKNYYVYSDDEDYETTTKKPPSRTVSKRAAAVEPSPPVSRSRATRSSDVMTRSDSVTRERGLDSRRSVDNGSLRPRRSDTSSKENRCFDESVKQNVLNIVDKLRKCRWSWPFVEPVDANEVPDYYKIIKKPIDLRTMEDKCISDVYLKPQQFIDDFVLMMKNAAEYNEIDTDVHKCIGPFEKYFEQLVERHLPQCSSSSSRR